MGVRWKFLLLPPLMASFLLFAVPQFVFLRMSLFADLGLGQTSSILNIANYSQIFGDPFYLRSLWLTAYLSTVTVALGLVFAFPVAYLLARMRSGIASMLLAVLVLASFMSVVIKVLGLIIIFSAHGPINRLLLNIHVVAEPLQMLGNRTGVVIGLLHYTLALLVLVLFTVIQTIPRSLEEAAQIHGAGRWRVFRRIVMPLSLPGIVTGGLMAFNLCMGAFTSAALLGGGKVLTLPVLIQRTIMLETKYGMGAALSAVLLISVFLVNLLSMGMVGWFRGGWRLSA